MLWIIYSLLAVTIFSVVNLFDKFYISKKFNSPFNFAILLNIIYLIFYLGYFILFNNTFIISSGLGYAIFSGFLYFAMWILWFKALSGGEVSRSSAIFFTQPLFSALLATVFLGEIIPNFKWMAIIFIVIGAILSSVESSKSNSGFNKAYIWAFLAAIVSALGNTVSKYATNTIHPLTVGAIGYFFTLPFYFLFLKDKKIMIEFKEKITDFSLLSVLLLRGGAGYAGMCLFMMALGSGNASLVSALNGVQPIFVLILSTIASIFYPKIIKEDVSKGALIYKIISVILIVVGAIIVSI